MADLFNIGKPRAFGQAIGRLGMKYVNPYKEGTPSRKAFTSGYFEGDHDRRPMIIPPDPGADDLPPATPPAAA